MVKAGEIQVYKNMGTYQLVIDEGNEFYEREKYYAVRHFSGLEVSADTVKEAKKCLEDFDRVAQEIQQAINKLTSYGYKVYKEIA